MGISIDELTLGPELLVRLPGQDGPVIICTRKMPVTSIPLNTQKLVYAGRCLYVGCMLRAGAADSIIRVADQANASGASLLDDDAPGTRTATFNGFVGQTILMDKGIVAQIDQADAKGWILFAPF